MGDAFSVPFMILSCQRQNCCFQLIFQPLELLRNVFQCTRYTMYHCFFFLACSDCVLSVYNLKNHSIKRKRRQVALLLKKRPTNAVGCSCWSGEAINSFSRGWLYFKFSFKVTEEVETALVTWMLILSYKNRVTRNIIPWRKNHLLFFYLVFEISSFTDPCLHTPFSS